MNRKLAMCWTLDFKYIICCILLNSYSNFMRLKKTLVTEGPSVLNAEVHYRKTNVRKYVTLLLIA